MDYNNDNIFAKILRGEIPCDKVSEEDRAMAFNDINPQAKVHALVIPKGAYISFADFSECADDAEIVSFVRAIGKTARQLGVEETGYRLLINTGKDANQEVPHLHAHIVGGQNLGKMLP
ncbi:MAG: histidine triad nucleotide-binding protein [Candidatus Zeuxoniibacter abyssi]|nr:MAG: histidine triad nucleotide-binding protein [Candidatus Persebacteraceae bacterium AB1(2)]